MIWSFLSFEFRSILKKQWHPWVANKCRQLQWSSSDEPEIFPCLGGMPLPTCTNRLICLSSQALCEDVELGGVCDYGSPLEISEPHRFWLQTATTSGQKKPCFLGVMEWIGCRVWGAWGGGFQVRQVPKAMQVGRDLLCLSVWVWKQTGATMIREPYPRILLSYFSRTWLEECLKPKWPRSISSFTRCFKSIF